MIVSKSGKDRFRLPQTYVRLNPLKNLDPDELARRLVALWDGKNKESPPTWEPLSLQPSPHPNDRWATRHLRERYYECPLDRYQIGGQAGKDGWRYFLVMDEEWHPLWPTASDMAWTEVCPLLRTGQVKGLARAKLRVKKGEQVAIAARFSITTLTFPLIKDQV
jgi:hypothetical protein